jgi:hypothetical protein
VSSGADARFRIRMEDGSEVPIASLEALARRIDRGEVLPDTELFDTGTNAWSPARESAVVRFILDEREHEGLEPLEEWEGVFDEMESGTAGGSGGSDPIDLGLTLEPGASGKTEEVDEDEVAPPLPSLMEEDPDKLPDLVFPGDEGPRRAPPSDPGPQGGTSLDEWSSPGAPYSPPATPTIPGEPIPGPPTSPVSRGKGPGRRPPPRTARKRPEAEPAGPKGGAGKWILAGIGVVAVLWAGVFLLGDRTGPTPDEPPVSTEVRPDAPGLAGTALVGEDLAGVAPVPSVPEGLDVPVARALRAVDSRFDGVVDSLRSVHGLADRPPPEWLSGYYLAHASQFPNVRAFWDGYASLVGELRARDPELYLETAVRAASDPDPRRSLAVEAYLEDRYRAVRPYRRERYIQLTRVAQRATALHDFLEANEAEIRFTPATGPEIPRDPIMEAEVERAEVRSELLRLMDVLFQALDLSRGGGPPAMGGLGQDLFRRFGEG